MQRLTSLRTVLACVSAGAWVAAVVAAPTQDTILASGGSAQIAPNQLILDEFGVSLTIGGMTEFGAEGLMALTVVGDHPYRMLATNIPLNASLTIAGPGGTVRANGFSIVSVEPGIGHEYTINDAQSGTVLFEVTGGAFSYDPLTFELNVSQTWLRVTDGLAAQIGAPRAANNLIATLDIQADMVIVNREPFGGGLEIDGLPGTGEPGTRVGGDVTYHGVSDISNHGVVGAYMAFTLGTQTCNMGNQNISWTNNGTPGVGFNAFRLHNGRMVQIGMGWVKTACCAAAGSGCGVACNGQGGSVLGAGCLDVYGSGWNAQQSRLMSRAQINAHTGSFGTIPAGGGDAVWRRAQVATADISAATYPGALYFLEGVYVGTQDSQFNNDGNNASYRRATVSGNAFTLQGTTVQYQPTITAWRLNGLGVGVPDPRVVDGIVDVPSEGRFHTAYKVTDNGDGTWTYDYAVYNLSSDRSGGSFEVPIPSGLTISNVGFNDVRYHSGDPYDNTDWPSQVGNGVVRWQSPQSFTQNPNSNAMRWGTMYSFWFTANAAPADGNATLGLFKPHTPQSVSFPASVPGGTPSIPGDLDNDGDVDLADLAILLSDFGCISTAPPCIGDINGDDGTDLADLAILLANYGS